MIKLKDLLKELESRDNYYIANTIMEPRLAVRKYFNANKESLEALMDQDRWNEVYQIIFKEFPQFEQHILATAINSEASDAGWLTKQVPVDVKLSIDFNSEVGEIQTTVSAWVAKNKNKLLKLADNDEYTKFYQAVKDEFPEVPEDKLLFAFNVAAVEHDIHYDVLTDGIIKLKNLVQESIDFDNFKRLVFRYNTTGKDNRYQTIQELIQAYNQIQSADERVEATHILNKADLYKYTSIDIVEESTPHEQALSYTEEQALKLAHKNWSTFTGKVCNTGFCDIYADKLSKLLPGSKIWSTEQSGPSGTFGHVWVEYKGKYYDAETPKGVTDWKQLPWMEDFYKSKKTYPTDITEL